MSLVPTTEENTEAYLLKTYTLETWPSKTYYMDLDKNRIYGYTQDYESMRQCIYCIVNTQRSKYPVYSDNYGLEFEDLFGMPMSYVIPEVERRIREALEWDTRINTVDGFSFETDGPKLHVTFTAHTIYGEIDSGTVVII
jgi:hypothetical protein